MFFFKKILEFGGRWGAEDVEDYRIRPLRGANLAL